MCDHKRTVCFLTLNYAKQREMLTVAGQNNLWVERYLMCRDCGWFGLGSSDRLSWLGKTTAGILTVTNYHNSKRLRARIGL